MSLRHPGAKSAGATVRHQLPLAWANFSGRSGGSLRDSRNITSVTRSSTGLYTITLQQAMNATEYVVFGGSAASSVASRFGHTKSTQNTTTSATLETRIANNTLTDFDVVTVACMGGV